MTLLESLAAFGLSKRESLIYLSVLQRGEATVADIAKDTRTVRTSLYYVLTPLISRGILKRRIRGKKELFVAAPPGELLRDMKERARLFEDGALLLEEHRARELGRPTVTFFEGPHAFQDAWEFLFSKKPPLYRIATEGVNFLDFVKEKYILRSIIERKRALKIRSLQLIPDSPYARKIADKDAAENRQTRFLPMGTELPATEILFDQYVLMIAPRFTNSIMLTSAHEFAQSRIALFDSLFRTSAIP
jgi:predicted DNA-binding transcriptional regulator